MNQLTKSDLELCSIVTNILDDKKAQDIRLINLQGKNLIADFIVIATATSGRHLFALADAIYRDLKNMGCKSYTEGTPPCDWVLIDAGFIIIHLFKTESREFYNLEKMWSNQ